MDILISLGKCASDAYPTRTITTWEQFKQWIYQHRRSPSGITPEEYTYLKQFPSKSPEGQRIHADKDGPYVVLADHGGNRRALDTLLGSYGVPQDFDSGYVNERTIRQTLDGYAWVGYSTYAHQPGAERWRVLVPVAAPMDAAQHRATWETISNAFPGGADPAAKDASRLSYLPNKCLYPEHARIIHADGALFVPTLATPAPPPVLSVQTDGPVPGWAGPTDDETLLAVACSLRNRPDERLGGAVHFAMLWTANEQWLGQHFPPAPNEQGQQYSRTQADMALAGELAYWTGSDAGRMTRLMRASGLARPEEDWQERKVLRAVERAIENAKQWHFMEKAPKAPVNVGDYIAYTDPETGASVTANGVLIPAPPPPAVVGSAVEADIANSLEMPGLNDYWGYMPTAQFIHRNTGDLHASSALDQRIGSDLRKTIMASRPVDRMTWAPGRPERFRQHEIDPACDPERPIWLYNKYRPPRPAVKAGDVSPWLGLLRRLYPDDADHIINYFADAVQHPERKCNHALVLGSGIHGVGKDTLLKPLQHAVGDWNFRVIKPTDLSTSYNPWVASRILLVSESSDRGEGAYTLSARDMYEKCKELCAAPPDTIEVNDKYVPQHPVLNVLRLILTTNHATDGIYLDPNDRRHYCAWSDAEKLDETEAEALWDWYRNRGGQDYVANYLSTFDLSGWNSKAPPPRTAWWHQLVDGGRFAENDMFTDALIKLGRPEWITAASIAGAGDAKLAGWMADPGNRRKVARELEKAGYRKLVNPHDERGRWYVGAERTAVYRRANVPEKEIMARFLRVG